MSTAPHFDRVALVGVGLIGSSMAHAMRRAGLAGHIAGYAHTPEIVARARAVGFADSMHDDLSSCVKDADLAIEAIDGFLVQVAAKKGGA